MAKGSKNKQTKTNKKRSKDKKSLESFMNNATGEYSADEVEQLRDFGKIMLQKTLLTYIISLLKGHDSLQDKVSEWLEYNHVGNVEIKVPEFKQASAKNPDCVKLQFSIVPKNFNINDCNVTMPPKYNAEALKYIGMLNQMAMVHYKELRKAFPDTFKEIEAARSDISWADIKLNKDNATLYIDPDYEKRMAVFAYYFDSAKAEMDQKAKELAEQKQKRADDEKNIEETLKLLDEM